MKPFIKPIILTDLDQTLSGDFHQIWLDLYNKDYGDNMTENDISTWDLHTIVKPECGEKIFDYLKMDGLFDEMVSPMEDSVAITKFLTNYFEIFVVSSCIPETVVPKAKFLKKHFLHIPEKHFIPCSHKFLIKGDYLIDDYHENLRYFDGNKILMNAPYNQNIDFENEVVRVNNWLDIYSYFLGEIENIKKNLSFEYLYKNF